MNRRQRRQAQLAAAARRGPSTPRPAAAAARPSRWRWLALGSVVLAVCAAIAIGGAGLRTAPGGTAPTIVEGDGVSGPQGMMWIPAGSFLMGSDHKLAQDNERPAHRVKIDGFWMDRTALLTGHNHHANNAGAIMELPPRFRA
jgi:formylglycine-generating enzyme required for sulfatase activity